MPERPGGCFAQIGPVPFSSIHPNDHVNLGQSTNDVFPTAIHVAAAVAIRERLIPALERCGEVLAAKAAEWKGILKIGRTHLADATPLSLGQEIGGLARQLERSAGRAAAAMEALFELPIGGTAVGTGINTHAEFGRRVCELLANETGIPFVEAADHFEANAQRDGLVECHGQLRTIAATLFNVANNIRWLASGPRCGFHEIKLPDRQPGSSIMPGKVNPVLCESLMQAAARVLGNDQTIVVCGAAGGQFQLNVMMPVMADAVLESIRLLANATDAFTSMCLAGMEADAEACEASVEKSLAMATGLTPYIGYERAAALAKEAFATGKTIRELCLREGRSSRGATQRGPRSVADDPPAAVDQRFLGSTGCPSLRLLRFQCAVGARVYLCICTNPPQTFPGRQNGLELLGIDGDAVAAIAEAAMCLEVDRIHAD